MDKHIKPYINGRDFTTKRRGIYVIDFFGLNRDDLKSSFPTAYQYLLGNVKPERDQNRNKVFKEKWWVIGHPRQEFRAFTKKLSRYIITVETMKHRVFGVMPAETAPDSTLVTFGLSEWSSLGILSSRIHVTWALAAGGRLGMGNDPRYNKSRCFETFPFPAITPELESAIGKLAERLDNQRRSQQAQHSNLTLTGVYNVLEKVRAEQPLTEKERAVYDQGLISLLKELHDDLDRAVFEAYGWHDLADIIVGRPGATTPLPDKSADQAEAEEELLVRLVALNAERAAEEAQGKIRWLRPEYQAPEATQSGMVIEAVSKAAQESVSPLTKKPKWPNVMPEQVEAVLHLLAIGAQDLESLAAHFKRRPVRSVEQVLAALEVLGKASRDGNLWRAM